MVQVTQSPFLQALGYALINSLWQFAILWLVYVFVHTVSKLSSHHKYASGLLLQVTGLGWFVFTLYFRYRENAPLVDKMPPAKQHFSFASVEYNKVTENQKFGEWIDQAELLLPWLSIAYIALLIFFGFRWLQVYRYTQAVRTEGLQKADAMLRLFVQRLSLQLGIKRTVSIYLSGLVKTPLTIGFFKPIILIPLASVNSLTSEQMEAVILHELAHIRRYDYLFNLCLALLEVTLFFNPFMHLISRHIKKERENCCDDWVLQYDYNAASYAHALLKIATQSPSHSLALNAADDKQILLNRIKRMIEKKERTLFHYRHQLLALMVITIVFCSLAVFSPSYRSNKADILPFAPGTFPNFYSGNSNNSLFLLPLTSRKTTNSFVTTQQDVNSTVKRITIPHPPLPAPLPLLVQVEKPSFLPEKTLPASPIEPALPPENLDENSLQLLDGENERIAFEAAAMASALPAAEVKSAEKQVKKLMAVLLKEKINISALQWDKQESKVILEQFIQKLRIEIDKLSLNINVTRNLNTQNQATQLLLPPAERLEQLNLIRIQIQEAIEEVKDQYILLTDNSAGLHYSLQIPNFSNNLPATQSVKDLQSSHTKRLYIKARKSARSSDTKNKNTIITIDNDDTDNYELTNEIATEAPEKPKESNVNVRTNIRMIKI